MIVWLWDAGSGRGVTDDQNRARRAAETLMRTGRADAARVEKARLMTGLSALTSGYMRTGDGWTAQAWPDGLIRWVPLPAGTATGGLVTGHATEHENGRASRDEQDRQPSRNRHARAAPDSPRLLKIMKGRDQMAQNEHISGQESPPKAPFDVTVPNVARIYDYLLGGKDNFQADRDAAGELYKLLPGVAQACTQNREFLRRAVRYLAGQAGIGQFIDIGSGLPTAENTHQIAQEIRLGARVVYADNDPVVVAHGRVLLASSPDVAVIEADLRRPATITANPALPDLVDPAEPVAFLLVAVLHFIQDSEDPYGIVNVLGSVMAPGS